MSTNKSHDFVKCLGEFFRRDLISIPLIKKYPHSGFQQRCSIRAATLELDTSSYPNIDYIAGNRLSIYPMNPMDHVLFIMKHLQDDISPSSQDKPARKKIKMSEPWAKFVQLNGVNSLRLALLHLYDITTAPSRDLLRLLAENCTNKEHKQKLITISKTDDNWEKWICQNNQIRTLKTTFEEFDSCKNVSAKSLISELALQQPRQYSISSIKSSKRFRTEIIIFQHKFTSKHIAQVLQQLKDYEESSSSNNKRQQLPGNRPSSSPPAAPFGQMQSNPTTVHVNHAPDLDSHRSLASVRSLRSMVSFAASPISTQQVKKVPSYSGPLMSLYASSALNSSSPPENKPASESGSKLGPNRSNQSGSSLLKKSNLQQPLPSEQYNYKSQGSSSTSKQFDGLCSNYLLNLSPNDHIVCEFVENPRFTLKGNRERPIMMIGQDIGVVSFRPFWQQRALEYDRAQVFYTLFKDLAAKKFGDMQLVCLTGNRCKIEDLFKNEINRAITHKIISSAQYINRSELISLLDKAAISSSVTSSQDPSAQQNNPAMKQALQRQLINQQRLIRKQKQKHLQIDSKELLELGAKMTKLLIEHNGCIYTCCDAQMTQAIEILLAECLARNTNLTRENIISLIPKWKGRKVDEQPVANNQFLFTLENPFERAQIVQEIYEPTM